ncbi:MAG: histidine kinase [Acidobacteria bacterium]|nr:histidine kinase [Acidobacteriota bacterium]
MKYLFVTGLGLFLFLYRHLDHLTRQDPIPWHIPFIEEMSSAYVLGLTAPLIIRMTRQFPPRWANLPHHLIAASGIGLLETTGFYIARLIVFRLAGLGAYDYGILWLRYFMELPIQYIGYVCVAGGTLFWDHRQRTALLELENLRLQLQPHFLFNTLNMISSVVYEDPAKADEMLCRLSDYLRDALAKNPAQEVPFHEEIATARAYLAIMEARFEHGLHIDWEIEDGIGKAIVPHFLLQPLAENSLRHGLTSIRARRDGDALLIDLEDTGAETSGGAGLGIGLGNTRLRLERLYGAKGSIELEPKATAGTIVKVRLPYRVAA